MIGTLLASVKKRGVAGTLGLLVLQVPFALRGIWRWLSVSPVHRYREWRWQRDDRNFDRDHGIRTTGDIPLELLTIDSPNVAHGVHYGPTPRGKFALAFEQLERMAFDFSSHLFLDLGSGKGRALLLASEWPFKEIIGVEFSPELDREARENIRAFHSPRQRCFSIRSVCADVLAYELPWENLAVYLYNPFDQVMLERVLARLEGFCDESGREVLVIYVNPVHGVACDRRPRLQRLSDSDRYALYRVVPRSLSGASK